MPKLTLNSQSINTQKILFIIIFVLLASSIFLGVKYFAVQKELKEIKTTLGIQEINEKVLDFSKFFIEKILMGEEEVGFEERLKLENAVRNLNDEKILAQWNKFVESETEAEAQTEVKNLLEMLINKIKI